MLYLMAALLILIADQALKYYVTLHIPLNEGVVTLIPGFMSLVNHHNTGAAFSMLSGGGARWAFVVLAVSITVAVIYLIVNRRIQSKAICWILTMICAGAMGNAIDRALYGYVVDMFRTDFMNFAIFNVADIFITCGGFALCLAILMTPSEKEKEIPFVEEDEHGVATEKTVIVQEKTVNLKLVSDKPKLPDEVAERRRTGKLYGEKKPFDTADPFAEFENKPKTFEKAKKVGNDYMDVPDSAQAEQLASKLRNELDLDAIVKEFSDGPI